MKAMIYESDEGCEPTFFDCDSLDDLLDVLCEHGYPPIQIDIEDDEHGNPRVGIEILSRN